MAYLEPCNSNEQTITSIVIGEEDDYFLSQVTIPSTVQVQLLASNTRHECYAYIGTHVITKGMDHCVPTDLPVVQMSCNFGGCVVLCSDGSVHWAHNSQFEPTSSNKQFKPLQPRDIVSLSSSGYQVLMLQRQGNLLEVDSQGKVSVSDQPIAQVEDYTNYNLSDGMSITPSPWRRNIALWSESKVFVTRRDGSTRPVDLSEYGTIKSCALEYTRSMNVLTTDGKLLKIDTVDGEVSDNCHVPISCLVSVGCECYAVQESGGTMIPATPESLYVGLVGKRAVLGNCYQQEIMRAR